MAAISEVTRERETLRFEPSLLSASIVNESNLCFDPLSLSTSPDTALTAFAQLGAFRLNCQRALISLFDHKYQHIVAEATQTSTLAPKQAQNVDGTPVWLSGTAIPRRHGICEHVLSGRREQVSSSHNSDIVEVAASTLADAELSTIHESTALNELPISVVPDLSNDPRFDWKSLVTPALRFYAGVPIRSPRGIDIGVYCVFDPEPRPAGLDEETHRFMRDMSRTVMSYLESKSLSRLQQQNTRMIRGIGMVVEGEGSMMEQARTADEAAASAASETNGASTVSVTAPASDTVDWVAKAVAQPEEPDTKEDRPKGMLSALHHQVSSGVSLGQVCESPAPIEPAVETPPPQPEEISSDQNKVPEARADSPAPATSSIDDSDLATVFSRAAMIMREATEVEGVVIVDATIQGYKGLVVGSGDTDASARDTASDDNGSDDDDPRRLRIPKPKETSVCKVLGFALSHESSLYVDEAQASYPAVPGKFLLSLLRRFPRGKIFTFDESGGIQTSDSETEPVSKGSAAHQALMRARIGLERPNAWRHRSDGESLAKIFEGARSVILVPMWDFQTSRWHAAGFVWTYSPVRVFSMQHELSYLTALGTVVMGEIARVNVLRADRSKSDVLGSISHELRSPLQGILANIELLDDTSLTHFQKGLLRVMEGCAHTQKETIDQLLDYSKINHFVQGSRRQPGSDRRAKYLAVTRDGRVPAGMIDLYADIELDLLAEDVLDSVYSGHCFTQRSEMLSPSTSFRAPSDVDVSNGSASAISGASPQETVNMPTGTAPPPPVLILLDIDPALDWRFFTQPGAIRRIIMNLFGNALKYTTTGSIVLKITQHKSLTGQKSINIVMSDTGKGISPKFLREKLFKAFTQEDHLAPGAGLGLSIVKQIVRALSGRIGVESTVGVGTIVRVFLPLQMSKPQAAAQDATDTTSQGFLSSLAKVRQMSLVQRGFATNQGANDNAKHQSLLQGCLQTWFGKSAVEDSTSPQAQIISATAASIDMQASVTAQTMTIATVVVCEDMSAAHDLTNRQQQLDWSRTMELISQPLGPRKITRALLASIDRHVTQADTATGGDLPEPVASLPLRTISSPHPPTPAVNVLPAPAPTRIMSDDTIRPSQQGGSDVEPMFLLVDDNPINLKVLEIFVKKRKQPYSIATNGLEALTAYKAAPYGYRCVLMDISMPIMDGLESTRRIRALEKIHGLKPALILVLTGLAGASTQQEAIASGVDMFMTKPVRLKELNSIFEAKGFW